VKIEAAALAKKQLMGVKTSKQLTDFTVQENNEWFVVASKELGEFVDIFQVVVSFTLFFIVDFMQNIYPRLDGQLPSKSLYISCPCLLKRLCLYFEAMWQSQDHLLHKSR